MTSTRVILLVICTAASCRDDERADAAVGASSETLAGARVVSSAKADDGQWTMAAKDYANTRFVGLDALHTDNVANLQLAWTFVTGATRGHEGAPIVVDDTMYVITPFPNELFALDLRNGGAVKWKYEAKPDPMAKGVACCDQVNRGGTYSDGRIYYATLDNHAVAVDAASGAQVWKTKIGDVSRGETITMAPIVVKDRMLVGNSGGEFGVRGWLTALDTSTGDIDWRAYATGPDEDVLIGAEFRPFYESDRGKDLGVSTWPTEKWKQGGGTSWGWVSYDPQLDLVYYGTANPGPWNAEMRPGDNKWTAGVFARRPETGAAVWFYQWSPHDLWDHDGINENILVDLEVEGRVRHVLLHPERNGYVYVMDRETGEVLSADPFVHITASLGVDLKTGRLMPNAAKTPHLGETVRDVCPFAPGAKDWQPSAFSPQTGLLYIPHNNMCMDHESIEVGYIAGTPYVGANVRMYAGPGGNRGVFTAWDPIARKAVWSIEEDLPVWSGALVTAGGLVFYGTMDGHFKAVDARTGDELWRYDMPSGIVGQPISYRGPDGKQYVAVFSGVGGWAGTVVAGDLDPRDQTAAMGFVGGMKDLPDKTSKGGTLYVFGL